MRYTLQFSSLYKEDNMKPKPRCYMMKCVAVFLLFCTFLTSTSLADELHFVSIEKLIEQEVGRIVLPQIYKKIGIEVSITPLPGNRAQLLATSGDKDGEIMRIWTYGENNSSVIRVPTPYYSLETMAFILKDSGIKISKKDDLKNYRIGKVRGVKHTDNISKDIPEIQICDVRNTKNAMQMLSIGRVDIVLTNTADGLLVIERNGLEDIIPISQPLAVLDLYNYIHKSKAHIVPRVDKVIEELKTNGELAEMIKQAETQILNKMLE